MSLDNLVGISLENIEPDSASIARLLAAAKRNIADANQCRGVIGKTGTPIARAGMQKLVPDASRTVRSWW